MDINIKETYQGIDLLIAQKCDDGNGILEEDKEEISIFTKAKQEFEASGDAHEVTIKGVKYYYDKLLNILKDVNEKFIEPKPHVEEPDALKVDNTNMQVAQDNIPYKPLPEIKSNHSTLYPNEPIDNEIFAQALDNVINAYLEKHKNISNSALLGQGQTYLNLAKEKNVDPFTLLGIAMHESAFGTSPAALKKNNIGGLKSWNKQKKEYQVIKYDTVADSIKVQARAIDRQNQRNTTIENIGKKGNYVVDTASARNLWIKRVSGFANNLVKEYNRLLSEKYLPHTNQTTT